MDTDPRNYRIVEVRRPKKGDYYIYGTAPSVIRCYGDHPFEDPERVIVEPLNEEPTLSELFTDEPRAPQVIINIDANVPLSHSQIERLRKQISRLLDR